MREIYTAIVTRVNDPKKLGRIRVKCQALAAAGVELPTWIKPCFPFTSAGSSGWFAIPDVGSEVEIEVNTSSADDETFNESFIMAPDIHWRAAMYTPENPVPDEFQKNYGKRRGLKTPSGHFLFFDDTDGDEEITLQHKGGGVVSFKSNGDIEIKATAKILMNGGGTPVAKEGSATSGHTHSGTGMTAGPYPVTGSTQSATDTINSGEGSETVEVP